MRQSPTHSQRSFTCRSKVGVFLLVLGLAVVVINPNFEAEDVTHPVQVLEKTSSHHGYENSGRVYLFAWAVGLAATLGLGVNALNGRLFRNP